MFYISQEKQIDILETEIARLEVENRNLKLKIEDLQRKIDRFTIDFVWSEEVSSE